MFDPAGAGDVYRDDFEQSWADDVRDAAAEVWAEIDDIMEAKRDEFLEDIKAE